MLSLTLNSGSFLPLKIVLRDAGRLQPTVFGEDLNFKSDSFVILLKYHSSQNPLCRGGHVCLVEMGFSFIPKFGLYSHQILSDRVSCIMHLKSRPPVGQPVRPQLPGTHWLSGKLGWLVPLKSPNSQIFPGISA